MTQPHDDQTEDATVPARPRPAPPRMIATVIELEESLSELQLLEPQQQTELIELRCQFSEPKELARELLQRDWLTPFQVNQLLQGKGRELTLGPYVLLERIGEGGMGAVYKARNLFMKRIVAIKLIRKDRLANPAVVQRFYREIQAAAAVQHPNVVVAYHADHIGDVHFLVMEYVAGGDLAKEVKKRGPLPVAEACDVVRQAALGLQHAHDRGLVHRDIKPGNLLLAQGVVKVLDLGLARLSLAGEQASGELTQEGAVMGTPDYIAPEQAQESHTVDARADVYSLGCTLYFLLSGKVPFPGGTLVQKLMKHQREEPPPIQSHRPEVSAGLAEVVARMMAKKPDERYQTAADAARALEPHCGKHAPVAIAVAGITASVPLAIPFTANPPVAIALSRDKAQGLTASAPMAVPLAGVAADASGETLPPGSSESSPSWASFLLRKLKLPDRPERRRWVFAGAGGGVLLLVLLILLLRSGKKPEPPKTGFDAFEAADIPAANRIKGQPKYLVGVLGEHRLRHEGLRITTLALHPQGKLAATVAPDGFIRLTDPETLVEQMRFDLRETVASLAFSHDGKYLAAGTSAGFIRLYDIEAGKELAPLRDAHKAAITQVAFSPRDDTLLSASDDTTVGVWNAGTRTHLYSFKKHKTPVRCVAFSPDGVQAVSGAGAVEETKYIDCEPIVWDVESGDTVRTLTPGGAPVVALAFHPDAKFILTLDAVKGFRWWNDQGQVDRTEPSQGLDGSRFHFSPDGRHFLAYSNHSPALTLWESSSGRNIRPAKLPVTAAAVFMPDNRRALVPCDDTLRVWDTIEDRELMPTRGHTRPVTFLSLHDDNRVLFSGGTDGLRRWDLEKKTDRLFEETKGSGLYSVSPSRRYVLTAPAAPPLQITLWDLASGRPIRTLKTPGFSGNLLRFLDDRQAVFDVPGGFALVWDVEKEKEEARHKIFPDGAVLWIVPFPDGKTWLCKGSSGAVAVWDLEQKVQVATWPSPMNIAAISADGKKLYYGTPNADVGELELPYVEGKSPPPYFRLHRSPIQCLALSPDGKRLVTADAKGHIVLWDTTIRGDNKLDEWDQPAGPAMSLQFADDRHLLVGNNNGTIYILRLPR